MIFNKITQDEYTKLYNSGVIDRVCPEPGYGDTINRTLYGLLSYNDIVKLFDFGESGSNSGCKGIYDHFRPYVINLDKFVDRKKGDMKFLKINFTSQHNTIDRLKKDIEENDVDDRFILFIANPRLYTYCYTPEKPGSDGEYLSVIHVGKYYKDPSGEKTWNAIYELDNFMFKKTGEHLFFRF